MQSHYDQIREKYKNEIKVTEGATDVISNILFAGAKAIGQGGDLGAAVLDVVASAVQNLGGSLIALGTGALAGAALSFFIPALNDLFPQASIPAAVAAITVGTAMTGGAAYIQSLIGGGGAGSSTAQSPPAGGATGSQRVPVQRPTTPSGFQSSTQAQAITIEEHYNFNGPMGGSPRRIARSIRDLLAAEEGLTGRRRRPA